MLIGDQRSDQFRHQPQTTDTEDCNQPGILARLVSQAARAGRGGPGGAAGRNAEYGGRRERSSQPCYCCGHPSHGVTPDTARVLRRWAAGQMGSSRLALLVTPILQIPSPTPHTSSDCFFCSMNAEFCHNIPALTKIKVLPNNSISEVE